MLVAIICAALLGLLLFGLGFGVSIMRARTNVGSGFRNDPADMLYKMVRAHGNTAEYAPMVALLILYLGTTDPGLWILWVMGITTFGRYLIVAGLVMSPTLANPHPFRFVGALLTYLGGILLCVAMLLQVLL